MITFEAKCMRCESVIKIDFEKKFGELKDKSDLATADAFLWNHQRFISRCPKCKKPTYHIAVTPIEGNINLIKPIGIIKDIKDIKDIQN